METNRIIAAPRKPMRRYGEINRGMVVHQCIRVGDLAFDTKNAKREYTRIDPACNLRRKLMYPRNGLYIEEVIRG